MTTVSVPPFWAANSFAELVTAMYIQLGNVSGATVRPEQKVFNNGNRNSDSGLGIIIVFNKFYTCV